MKARILHVVYSLSPGGMENGIVNMANELDPGKIELAVLYLSKQGEMASRLPLRTREFILGKRPGFDLSLVPKIAHVLSSFRPDIVHTHNLGPLIYVSLSRPFTDLNFRLVHGEHASMTVKDMLPKKRFQRAILYSTCDLLHTVGMGMTQEFACSGLTTRKIYTLSNGVGTERFSPPSSKASLRRGYLGDVWPGGPVVLLVGRFGPYKGHTLLLDAFRDFGSESKDAMLVFVGGGGELESSIRALAHGHPFSDRIFFTGFKQDPLPYYQMADLVVVPSENEGLSNCILESMSCGTPVITYDSCGAHELVGENERGFLLKNNNPEMLSLIIMEVLRMPPRKLESISIAAREFVCQHFSIQSMRRNYSKVYTNYCRAVDTQVFLTEGR